MHRLTDESNWARRERIPVRVMPDHGSIAREAHRGAGPGARAAGAHRGAGPRHRLNTRRRVPGADSSSPRRGARLHQRGDLQP